MVRRDGDTKGGWQCKKHTKAVTEKEVVDLSSEGFMEGIAEEVNVNHHTCPLQLAIVMDNVIKNESTIDSKGKMVSSCNKFLNSKFKTTIEDSEGPGLSSSILVTKGPLVDGHGVVNVLPTDSQTESHEADPLIPKHTEVARRWKRKVVLTEYKKNFDFDVKSLGKHKLAGNVWENISQQEMWSGSLQPCIQFEQSDLHGFGIS